MRDPRMEMRLAALALWRRRGASLLAVIAIAIGASVAAALLEVSRDVGDQLSHQLRALGPNLLIVPRDDDAAGTAPQFLPRAATEARLAGLDAAPELLVVARVAGQPVPVIGTDLARMRGLHPAWRLDSGPHASWIGARLADRLGLAAGSSVELEGAGGRRVRVPAGARLQAGGADDDAWWIPIETAEALGGRADAASLFQARVAGGSAAVERVARALESDGTLRARVLHALSDTEAGLLRRMRQLMALVTVAALLAAGLCAFGTLTDLALERRRDIALMKSLGASRGDVVRLFATESLVIGTVGGVAGWLIGLTMAQVIGREVFHAAITPSPDVPLLVLALALVVAAVAGLGPIRLALAVEPAQALKGD
ncbi:MAG TPA: FtsX-like permease family protein [Candidatus Saccharimonadaceae bacterium]|jgi:putative ABC transport system permease protein|nr:FtsX-like permease family protein [Candidatus Saccharimonadaceae bacterium]